MATEQNHRAQRRERSTVTIKDVAAASGVSIATVSRCFNGGERVLAETLVRVHEAARTLGYTPSRMARGLVTGRSSNLGVVLPDVTNPFYAPLLAAVEAAAQVRDNGVFIGDSREDPEAEERIAGRMVSQTDGVVLVSSRMPDDAVLALSERVPVVLANRLVTGMDCALIDIGPAFMDAVDHLVELGHQRILYLGGPETSWSGRAKETAARAAATRSGTELVVWGPHQPSFTVGHGLAQEVVAHGFSAVICYDDIMALGVLSGCADLGIAVPTELSIVGCDDALPTGLARPALTTIRARSDELGQHAVELLMARIADRDAPPEVRQVAARLVVRGSTAPAGTS